MSDKVNDGLYGLTEMNDIHYLKKFITSIDYISHSLLEPMIAIKSIHSKSIYFSQYWADKIGVSVESILGTIVCPGAYESPEDIEEQIQFEDNIVVKEKKGIVTIKINHIDGKMLPYYCHKSPIINSETGNVIGILCQGYALSPINFQNILLLRSRDESSCARPALTQREMQVAFLFTSQLNSRQIAEMLTEIENKNVTKSTIDSIFNDKLYPKFNVFNRKDLYIKLHQSGYASCIPQGLLKANSFVVDAIKTD